MLHMIGKDCAMYASASKRLVQAFMAVVVAVALAGIFGLATTQTAHAASVKASSSTTAKAKKFASYKATTGSTKSSAKPLASIKIKGITGLKYSANSTTKFAKTGKATKAASKGIEYITVKLPASKVKTYNIYYRVYLKGYGWMGWAKNGAKAGTKGNKMYITALQVKLVKKTATQPNTDRAAYAGKNGFVKKITGNTAVDIAIKSVAKSNGMNLEKCMAWAASYVQYGPGSVAPTTTAQFTAAMQKDLAAKTMPRYEDGEWKKGHGDCYTFSVTGAYYAKYLGYKAYVGVGQYASTGATTDPTVWKPYSWTVVKKDGQKVIFDMNHNVLSITPAAPIAANDGKPVYEHFRQL